MYRIRCGAMQWMIRAVWASSGAGLLLVPWPWSLPCRLPKFAVHTRLLEVYFFQSQFLCVGNESTECQKGLYFWVSRLAPGRWMPLACWLTGWFNWIGLACECMRHTAYRSMDTDILSSRYHFRWSRTFTIHSRCHQRLVCKSIYM